MRREWLVNCASLSRRSRYDWTTFPTERNGESDEFLFESNQSSLHRTNRLLDKVFRLIDDKRFQGNLFAFFLRHRIKKRRKRWKACMRLKQLFCGNT
jgi:hypothetical protein